MAVSRDEKRRFSQLGNQTREPKTPAEVAAEASLATAMTNTGDKISTVGNTVKDTVPKSKKRKGPKGPNPLSVKKKKIVKKV